MRSIFHQRRPPVATRSTPREGLCSECQAAIRELLGRLAEQGQDATLAHREIAEVINRCGCLIREKGPLARSARGPAELRVKVVSPPAPALRVTTVDSAPIQTSDDPAHASGEGDGLRAESIPQVGYRLTSGLLVRVLFPSEVCRALREHCKSSNDHGREIGGMLVGFRHASGEGDVSVIATDILPMNSSDSSQAHVRLDAEAWFRVGEEFETRFRPKGKERLGWYHTHPSQGIFFSKQDQYAHSVFTLPHQFALVVDPKQMQAGLFYWEDLASLRLSKPHRFSIDLGSNLSRERSPRGPAIVTRNVGDQPRRQRWPARTWRPVVAVCFGLPILLTIGAVSLSFSRPAWLEVRAVVTGLLVVFAFVLTWTAARFSDERRARGRAAACQKPREMPSPVVIVSNGRGSPSGKQSRMGSTAWGWIFLVILAWLVTVFVAISIVPS